MSKRAPLKFEEFQSILADLLDLDAEILKPEAYFITDLGMDSIKLAGLLLRMEELGVDLSFDTIWQIQTVRDAYAYYLEQHGQ